MEEENWMIEMHKEGHAKVAETTCEQNLLRVAMKTMIRAFLVLTVLAIMFTGAFCRAEETPKLTTDNLLVIANTLTAEEQHTLLLLGVIADLQRQLEECEDE